MRSENELSVGQAAKRLGVTRQSVYILLWNKKLTGRKSGTRWLISKASIQARERQRKANQWQTA